MRPFMIRNNRHKTGGYMRKLQYGKTYWICWAGCNEGDTFTLTKGKMVTLIDDYGKLSQVSKRWMRKLLGRENEYIQFLVELHEDYQGKDVKA